MNITVALDGSKTRNLEFYSGDEITIALVVYQADGDIAPISAGLVTAPRIVLLPTGLATIPVSAEFVVPETIIGRVRYRLVAEVSGVTTTLCDGVITTKGDERSASWDYGLGWWGW